MFGEVGDAAPKEDQNRYCGIEAPRPIWKHVGRRQVTDIEIGAFLIAAGSGPEKQELLRLIATLV